jgi:hypothetical protein
MWLRLFPFCGNFFHTHTWCGSFHFVDAPRVFVALFVLTEWLHRNFFLTNFYLRNPIWGGNGHWDHTSRYSPRNRERQISHWEMCHIIWKKACVPLCHSHTSKWKKAHFHVHAYRKSNSAQLSSSKEAYKDVCVPSLMVQQSFPL